jgi:hypothetical protein
MPTLTEELTDVTAGRAGRAESECPFLYIKREYPELQPNAGRTTTCKVPGTSPVSEYGPDD